MQENTDSVACRTKDASGLLDNAPQHCFKYPAVAKYNYVIKEKIVKPSIVRASVNARNMASVNLLKKVGFSYSGTIHQQRIDPYTKEKLDVNQYYIEAKDYIHK